MNHVFPTYRGKDENGNVVMDMVDRMGRTWGHGEGVDRVQAQIAARKSMPPTGLIRKTMGWAKNHPIKAAMFAATAIETYQCYSQVRDGREASGLSIGKFLLYAGIAYVGIKVLGMFLPKNSSPEIMEAT